MEYKVLIADDSDEALKSFEYQLKPRSDIKPILVNSAARALEEVRRYPKSFAAVILDFHFDDEGINGAQLVETIKDINNSLQIIICTGDESREALAAGFDARVDYFISKDDINKFTEALEKCFTHYDEKIRVLSENTISLKRQYDENEKYIKTFGMVSRSDDMRKICETIEKCKDENTTVLIRGESGTGKELVAKAFHEKSSRADKKFVAINCAAIAHNLFESELFGHKKGAFTGADRDATGKFELANKGTIFLDEIGDMPMDLQVKLLRVLQEGRFYPVGAREEVSVDVRVIAATNVNLEKAVERGHFRQDLYFRLKVIEIDLPPLRDRIEDIEPLILFFQKRHAKDPNRSLLYSAVEVLKRYKWDGNIRELENVIHRTFTLSSEQHISPESLPRNVFENTVPIFDGFNIDSDCDYESFAKAAQKYLYKKEYDFLTGKIKSEKTIRNAAKKLKLSKSALHRKLKLCGYSENVPTEEVAT